MTEGLAGQRCEACNASTPRLDKAAIAERRGELDPAWDVVDASSLRRDFRFETFRAAFSRATAIALLAEEQGHHPDLEIGWGRLRVLLTTHSIGGLSHNDFVMAAKIDHLNDLREVGSKLTHSPPPSDLDAEIAHRLHPDDPV
jgi:4a-hydroxytetrahydrobiopterin dehydratase